MSDHCTNEKKEERRKVKNYLWCVEKLDKTMENFANIADAVRKATIKDLTKAYFYPGSITLLLKDYDITDVKKSKSEVNNNIIKHSFFDPPSWFCDLTKKQVDAFIKIYKELENPGNLATDKKITNALKSLDLGLDNCDVDDLKDVFELRHLGGLEFGEFAYGFASLDRVKKIVARIQDENDREYSKVQRIFYSALIHFTVASCCISNGLEKMEGVSDDVMHFYACNSAYMDVLSSCMYNRIKAKFQATNGHQCSPYYHSLCSFKQAMNHCPKKQGSCKDNNVLNPYAHHMIMTEKSDLTVDEDVIQGVFDMYTKNGCLATSLPLANRISCLRVLISKVTIYEPICCGSKRRDEIKKTLTSYRDNVIKKLERMRILNEMHSRQLKIQPTKLKVAMRKVCFPSKEIENCFTSNSYTNYLDQIRRNEKHNLRSIFEAMAARNRSFVKQLESSTFPGDMGERFKEIFEIYNPTDPNKLVRGFTDNWKNKEPKEAKDRDAF